MDNAEQGRLWLNQLLELTGLTTAAATERDRSGSDDSCWLTIDSAQLSAHQIASLTGERGQALDAMQYLANTTLNLGLDKSVQTAYTIELDGYRVRRQEELERLVAEAAEKVRESGEEFSFDGLSSAERRQVHTLFKDMDDLATESQGKEPDRRLVVRRQHPSP